MLLCCLWFSTYCQLSRSTTRSNSEIGVDWGRLGHKQTNIIYKANISSYSMEASHMPPVLTHHYTRQTALFWLNAVSATGEAPIALVPTPVPSGLERVHPPCCCPMRASRTTGQRRATTPCVSLRLSHTSLNSVRNNKSDMRPKTLSVIHYILVYKIASVSKTFQKRLVG